MAGFLSKLLTFGEGKQLKNYQALADKIGGLEPEMQAKSDEQLRAFTDELRGRVQAGASTADVLPEAFAAVREASVRTLGMRHFDVQLIGGMALNEGQIAEMKHGRGQDARVHACRLSQRPCRAERAHRHRQRLPGAPRQRVDGAGVPRFWA